MRLTFLGAAERVTGSCYLISVGHRNVLLDCGQFQGSHEDEALNLEPLPHRHSPATPITMAQG